MIRFALPVLGALILQAAYGAVDLMVIGRFGDASGISAVGTGSTFMQTVSAFVAQNVGAGKADRAKKGFITAIVTGCSAGVFIFFVGFFGGGFWSSFFTKDAEVIAQSALYLKGFSADCILTCVLFSCIGYFNGYGNSIPVMLQGITSAFCIRIPVSILMSKLPNTSLMLVGFATPITTIYGIIFFAICFAWVNHSAKRQHRS